MRAASLTGPTSATSSSGASTMPDTPRLTKPSTSDTCESRSSSRSGPRQIDVDAELLAGAVRAGVNALPEHVRRALRDDGDRQRRASVLRAVLAAAARRSHAQQRCSETSLPLIASLHHSRLHHTDRFQNRCALPPSTASRSAGRSSPRARRSRHPSTSRVGRPPPCTPASPIQSSAARRRSIERDVEIRAQLTPASSRASPPRSPGPTAWRRRSEAPRADRDPRATRRTPPPGCPACRDDRGRSARRREGRGELDRAAAAAAHIPGCRRPGRNASSRAMPRRNAGRAGSRPAPPARCAARRPASDGRRLLELRIEVGRLQIDPADDAGDEGMPSASASSQRGFLERLPRLHRDAGVEARRAHLADRVRRQEIAPQGAPSSRRSSRYSAGLVAPEMLMRVDARCAASRQSTLGIGTPPRSLDS